MEDFELNSFNAVQEMFLRVIVPRLPAYKTQLYASPVEHNSDSAACGGAVDKEKVVMDSEADAMDIADVQIQLNDDLNESKEEVICLPLVAPSEMLYYPWEMTMSPSTSTAESSLPTFNTTSKSVFQFVQAPGENAPNADGSTASGTLGINKEKTCVMSCLRAVMLKLRGDIFTMWQV